MKFLQTPPGEFMLHQLVNSELK